jgi:ABC-type uncharacterized transport system ATPase subunit
VRCLLQNPRILIMDEPTSVLTPQEAEKLFTTLRQLAQEGCSVARLMTPTIVGSRFRTRQHGPKER